MVASEEALETRGFAMRRGRRAKLQLPKRGRAAVRAEIMGQGKEVLRGRGSFSRSVNRVSRCWHHGWHGFSLAECLWMERRAAARATDELIQEELRDWLDWGDVSGDDSWLDEDADWWEDGDALIEKADLPTSEKPPMDPLKQRLLDLSQSLRTKHSITLAEISALQCDDAFSALRRNFLFAHGPAICRDLQRVYRQHLQLVPAPLGDKVQQRFLEACVGEGKASGRLTPAFHGTAQKNISSILKQGLLIPGEGNSLPVVNGSAHGLGIYTGACGLGGASLSHIFCGGGPMLICGVMDDAQPVQQYTLGLRSISAESKHVRHVGSAIVIFETRRVAPFFVAVPSSGRWCAQSFAPLKKSSVIVAFDWARHERIVARVKEQYPEQRSDHWHGPRSRSCKEFQESRKYFSRRAARKRRPKLS